MAITEATHESRTRRVGAGRTHRERRSPNGGPERLARALGWFSLGLGLAEMAAPRRLAHLIGIGDSDERRLLLRLLGLREIANGAGILRGRRPAGWMWSRVGGDAIDLSLLGQALRLPRVDRNRLTTATVAVAGLTALDVLASGRLSRTASQGIRVRKAITIERSPEELYAFWRRLENLPRIMRHLDAVQVIDDRRSHWTAKAPGGTTVEWDAEIVEEQPNRRIVWRSLDGATVASQGSVEFEPAPGGRGTIVRIDLAYDPPAGAVGAAVAKLFGEAPDQQIAEDLRRLKQMVETGEVSTARGPAARRRPSRFGQ